MLDVKATIEILKQAQRELEGAMETLERGDSRSASLYLDDAATCIQTAQIDFQKHAEWLKRR